VKGKLRFPIMLLTLVAFTVCAICPSVLLCDEPTPTQSDTKQVSPNIPEPKAEVTSAATPKEASAENEAENKEPEAPLPPVDPGNITVNFKGADIKTVLTYISEVAGVDIVPAPDVKGVIDLKLNNKPWKTALDIILRNYGFAYEREGDIIRVVTVDKLKQEELATQAFNLNYGKSKEIVNSIKDIVTERGKVMYDERTNTVLVTDIPTNIYKVGQIIERLDKRTQQVLIEARIIETVLDDSEKLGIDWNVKVSASGAKIPTTFPFKNFTTGNAWVPQVQTDNPTSTETTSGGGLSSTTASEFPSDASGVFAFPYASTSDFTYGSLDFSEFTAVLEMISSRSNTDIVSNPRIATLNNMEALINIGQTLNLPRYERNSSTGKMEITGYESKDLGIILKVTPHINENNEIVVDLAPQISYLIRYDTLDATSGVVAPVFSARQAKTQVMVKDGDTIFIGGLIKENDVDTKTKIPILGDLIGDVPYLGLLVSQKSKTKQKTELIFFITVHLMTIDGDVKDVPKPADTFESKYTLTQAKGIPVKKREKKRN